MRRLHQWTVPTTLTLASTMAFAQHARPRTSSNAPTAPIGPLVEYSGPVDTRAAGTPVAPRLGAHTVHDRPRFSWTALPTGTSARLEVARTRDFASPAIHSTVTGSFADAPAALAPGRWYWRIVSDSDPGTSRVAMFVVRANHGDPRVSWGWHPDVDGDGSTDVLAVHQDWEGTRSGTAVPIERLSAGTGVFPSRWQPRRGEHWLAAIDVDDLNEDGATDMLVVNPVRSGFAVEAIESARGDRLRSVSWRFAPGAVLVSIYPAGDLDRDGRIDYLGTIGFRNATRPFVATASGHVEVLSSLGDGRVPVAAVAAGDVDGDGYEDVAFVSRGGAVANSCIRWVPGGSSGPDLARASERCASAATDWRYLGPAAAGDFDGDGRADLAVLQGVPIVGTRRVAIFAGGANPLGTGPVRIVAEDDRAVGVDGPGSGAFGEGLAAADTNADGTDELWIADPDAAGGRGRVFGLDARHVFTTLEEIDTSRLANVGSSGFDAHDWLAAGEMPPPDFGPQLAFVGETPPRITAHAAYTSAGDFALRPGPRSTPGPSRDDGLLAQILDRDAAALRDLVRRRPHLALGAALLVAVDAHDTPSIQRLDHRLRAIVNADNANLDLDGATPLLRAIDAIRIGLIAENDDRGITVSGRLCRTMFASGTSAVQRFDDRWGSSLSGSSEGARGLCIEPLMREALGDTPHTADVLTAMRSIHALPFAMFANAPLPFLSGTIEHGYSAQAGDTIDAAILGTFADTTPTDERLASAERRLARAVASRRDTVTGMQPRVDALLAGLPNRIALVAEGACAVRRLRGAPANPVACERWTRVYVIEAVAHYVQDGHTAVNDERDAFIRLDEFDADVW